MQHLTSNHLVHPRSSTVLLLNKPPASTLQVGHPPFCEACPCCIRRVILINLFFCIKNIGCSWRRIWHHVPLNRLFSKKRFVDIIVFFFFPLLSTQYYQAKQYVTPSLLIIRLTHSYNPGLLDKLHHLEEWHLSDTVPTYPAANETAQISSTEMSVKQILYWSNYIMKDLPHLDFKKR